MCANVTDNENFAGFNPTCLQGRPLYTNLKAQKLNSNAFN